MSDCETCDYKRIHNDEKDDGFCYMFPTKTEGNCGQYKPVNVGTIGHIDHSNLDPKMDGVEFANTDLDKLGIMTIVEMSIKTKTDK